MDRKSMCKINHDEKEGKKGRTINDIREKKSEENSHLRKKKKKENESNEFFKNRK